MPWHEFVLEYVAHQTLSAQNRALVGDMQVVRARDGWTWGMNIRGKFRPSFRPSDASTAYGYLFRTPLSYFAREGNDARTSILTPRGNPSHEAGYQAMRREDAKVHRQLGAMTRECSALTRAVRGHLPRANPPTAYRGETETKRGTARVIFRCSRDKTTWAKDYEAVTFSHPEPTGRPDSFGYRIAQKRRTEFYRIDPTGREIRPDDDKTCPRCARRDMVGWRPVEGTVNKRIPCDARCWNATGPQCSCSCGGENHARNSVL
jgi:hypothetical protein